MRRLAPVRTALFTAVIATLLAAGGWWGLAAWAQAPSRLVGARTALGNGTVASYAELSERGELTGIGVVFSPAALDGLPVSGSDQLHCFDKNRDGTVDPGTECLHTYAYILPLPEAVARREDVPFKWALLNWNPGGHIPPGVYDVPHFDVHFYMEPVANITALEAGPCGPEMMRCDQFEIGRQPVPSNYMHPDFQNVDAVVPRMGNHLIDLTGPEFRHAPFTRSWIYGVYGGKVIFYEEMVAYPTLAARPRTCNVIKQPKAVATAGFYPTASCLRYEPATGETVVSMERFSFRPASPPEP
jgi:hypothetical protein